MMLNVSSYEPISMLLMGFFLVFSKCSYSVQEMDSAKFVLKNVSQHFQKYQTNILHFHDLVMEQHTIYYVRGKISHSEQGLTL